jgi:hypothetical protein
VGGVEGAHILCVHLVESPFLLWNIYHAELEPSSRLIWLSNTAPQYERFSSLVGKGATSRGVGHKFKSWNSLKNFRLYDFTLWFSKHSEILKGTLPAL